VSAFIQIFLVSSVRRFYFGDGGVSAVQGHPWSIESAYATSY